MVKIRWLRSVERALFRQVRAAVDLMTLHGALEELGLGDLAPLLEELEVGDAPR